MNDNSNKTSNDGNNMLPAVFKGDCEKGIHWYIGEYSNGVHIWNKCAYCSKRKSVE